MTMCPYCTVTLYIKNHRLRRPSLGTDPRLRMTLEANPHEPFCELAKRGLLGRNCWNQLVRYEKNYHTRTTDSKKFRRWGAHYANNGTAIKPA